MGKRLERLGDEIAGDIYLSLTENLSLVAGAAGFVGSLATNVINNWHAISTSQATYPEYTRGIGTSILVGVGVFVLASASDYAHRKISHRED